MEMLATPKPAISKPAKPAMAKFATLATSTVAIPRDLIMASGYLSALLENKLQKNAKRTIDVKSSTLPEFVSDVTLSKIVSLFKALPGLKPNKFSEEMVSNFYIDVLPQLFAVSSFLQLHCTTAFLVQVLNYLAKIDDPRLFKLTGSVNPYWLGDQIALNTAAKLWLGLIHPPLTAGQEDASCYSSIKLLKGRVVTTTLLTLITFNNPDKRCATVLSGLDISRAMQTTDEDFPALVKHWVTNGYLHTLKVAGMAGLTRFDWFVSKAAFLGQVEILKWAIESGYTWSENALEGLVFSHSSPTDIKWALHSGAPRNSWALDLAVSTGQLETLNILFLSESKTCQSIMENAAEHGHLHIIKWALQQGFSLKPNVRQLAELNGYSRIVAWCDSVEKNGNHETAWKVGFGKCF